MAKPVVEFEDVVADVETKEAEKLLDALRNAETCECKEDLVANLREAMDIVAALKNDIGSLLKRAQCITE